MTDDAAQVQLKEAIAGIDSVTAMALAMLHQAHDRATVEIDDAGVMHGERVTYVPTDKRQSLATAQQPNGEQHVEGIVAHWTDTRGCGAVNLARRIAVRGGTPRSCHLWIDAAGNVAQSVDFKHGSWHAGSNTALLYTRRPDGIWEPVTPAQRGKIRAFGANSWAVGIEFENVGEVRLVAGEWLGWPFRHDFKNADGSIEKPAIVPEVEVASDPANPGHGHHLFTEPQIAAGANVYSALIQRYAMQRPNVEWGHCNIDPERRTDPGPLALGERATNRQKPIGGFLKKILDNNYGA